MATTKKNESKIVNKTTPRNSSKKESEAPRQDSLDDIISKTTAATFDALKPYLMGGQSRGNTPNEKQAKQKVVERINRDFDGRVKENREFMRTLASAPKEDFRYISIPRVFAKYLGSKVVASLNNSTITIPVDGRTYRVHKWYIPIIKQRIEYIDEKVAFMDKTDFSDVLEVDQGDLGK